MGSDEVGPCVPAVVRIGRKGVDLFQALARYKNYLDCLILENGKDRLSRNMGNKQPIYAALKSQKTADVI